MSDTIVVAGTPRSGTTLVQEVLGRLPGYKTINEPLLTKTIRSAHGFETRSYFPVGARMSKQEAFLKAALTGQLGTSARWVFDATERRGILREHARKRKLLVKFCRINRCLHWFVERFPTRGVVFVIRHPCSVISSMLKYGQWEKSFAGTSHQPDSPLYLAHLPEPVQAVFEPVVEQVCTREEALAAVWCLDNYLPLMRHREHPWTILPYERLIRFGRPELERVARAVGVEVTEEMARALSKPSSSVKGQLGRSVEDQLGKWRKTLSPRQIEGILGVVDAVGLSMLYSEDVDPSYEALNQLQLPSSRWESQRTQAR